jgi:hypothetical protein
MVARSTRSNQRPDTLMQDRRADRSTKPSCDARPDHTFGVTIVVVAQNSDGQLTLTVGSQPAHKLRPYQRRTFLIGELEGFRAEFHLGPDGEVDELDFHQPDGTFVGRRT